MKKLMLLVFNDLSSALVAQWMACGALPNFNGLYGTPKAFTTCWVSRSQTILSTRWFEAQE